MKKWLYVVGYLFALTWVFYDVWTGHVDWADRLIITVWGLAATLGVMREDFAA